MKRISNTEKRKVQKVLDSQFSSSRSGIIIRECEKLFAKIFKTKYAISFINGTATMHATLSAAGIKRGDEVIVPPLTMASTSFAILHAGATPIYADIDEHTWTISPREIEKRLSKKTKAIIPVSIYGLSADIDPIMAIAKKQGLFVLEDDAQCVLGTYKGKIVGSTAHASSFSFQSSKHITAGEGGMIITNDKTLATNIRRFSSLGYAAVDAQKGKISRNIIQSPSYERHSKIGFNYRMPELCAAVILGQLERIKELVNMRKKVAEIYQQAISAFPWLIPQHVPRKLTHSYWTFAVRLNHPKINWNEFKDKYIEMGGDGFYGAWKLTYTEPAFKENGILNYCPLGTCPVAEKIQPQLIQLQTNYLDLAEARKKAAILKRTAEFFN